MKTAILVIMILITIGLTSLLAQNTSREDPLNGKKTEYYPDGKVSKVYMMENGQLNGIYKFYTEKGFLSTEQEFFHGVPHGYYKTFFENGVLRSNTNYENGIPKGRSLEYYEDGTLKLDSYLTGEPGEYTGYTNLFYEDGRRQNETKVEKGKLVISISYDKQGRVTSEESEGSNISYWYENNGKKHTVINGVEQD